MTKIMMKIREISHLMREEDGIGTVEIILIMVVIIGLILIFKNQLMTLVNNTFSNISSQAGTL
ncbi:MAG: hypothetical protein LUE90_07070 [Clostridiales bacterium]|nr:hypothetical protein [Clostridiales bacterium]